MVLGRSVRIIIARRMHVIVAIMAAIARVVIAACCRGKNGDELGIVTLD
jgi:hypothetical protein